MSLRKYSPAADRNKSALLMVLKQALEKSGFALVIADGTGQHTAFFAEHFKDWTWQPTDYDTNNLISIDAWCHPHRNVKVARQLDVRDDWPSTAISAVFNANMIHISDWSTCVGLMRNGGKHLAKNQPLILYGPFKENGVHTAPSNASFDKSLRLQNPTWGVRDLEAVEICAQEHGLYLENKHIMPANNLTLIFRKQ